MLKSLTSAAVVAAILCCVSGAVDDYHVEQFHSPAVERYDVGTHMASGGDTWRRDTASLRHPDFSEGGSSSSSKHEYHQEQRYVNGQPVYEKRHERRYEDGRLVYEDGHEEGDPYSPAAVVHGSGSTTGGGASSSYYGRASRYGSAGLRSSSPSGYGSDADSSRSVSSSSRRSSYSSSSSSGGFEGSPDKLIANFPSRSQAHEFGGGSSSVHEENVQESHFVNGQQVYRKKQEKRYEDGRLVHNVNEEEGYQQSKDGLLSGQIGSGTSSQLSSSQQQQRQSSIVSSRANNNINNVNLNRRNHNTYNNNNQYSSPAATSYRASYWRPGDRDRRYRARNSQQISSSTNSAGAGNQISQQQSIPARSSTSTYNSRSSSSRNSVPNQTSYRRVQPDISNTPTYRASYTPRDRSTASIASRRRSQAVLRQGGGTGSGFGGASVPRSSTISGSTGSNQVVVAPHVPASPTSTSTSTRRQYSSSASSSGGYRAPIITTSSNAAIVPVSVSQYPETSSYHGYSSYSNKPAVSSSSYNYNYNYNIEGNNDIDDTEGTTNSYSAYSGYNTDSNPEPVPQSSSGITAGSTSTQYQQQQYGSAPSYSQGHVTTTASPIFSSAGNTRTTTPANRITDRYTVPYSLRSSSYQPSRFANYSAWSHWKKESAAAGGSPDEYGEGGRGSTNSYNRGHQQTFDRDGSTHYAQQPTSSGSYSSTSSQQNTYNSGTSGGSNIDGGYIGGGLSPGYLFKDNLLNQEEDGSGESGYDGGYRRTSSSQYEQSSVNSGGSNGYPSFSSVDDTGSSEGGRTGASSATRTSSSSTSRSSTSTSSAGRDASIGADLGRTVDLSILVDVGEGGSVRLGNVNTNNNQDTEENTPERYDISPITDGTNTVGISNVDNEVNTEHGRSSSISSGYSSSTSGSSRGSLNNEVRSGYNSGAIGGATYGTTRITNRTTNTMTSSLQPLVSSYKLETRTSRKYLNGKLVSETKFNRYYENGVLVHQNYTERSRDEMQTDGINVNLFDLSVADMTRYGMLDTYGGAYESGPIAAQIPMSHSQRFEMREEKEFVDGNQVYQSTHERHFQDGELVHEDHDEKDKNDLAALGIQGNLNNYYNSNSIYGRDGSLRSGSTSDGYYGSSNRQQQTYSAHNNDNNYNNYDTNSGTNRGRLNTGLDRSVSVSVSPISRTHKTEVRQEQEYRNGQQVYDLRHEKQFDNGALVHEDLSEKGPEELGADETGHRDALYDILSGRTLATAPRHLSSTGGYRKNIGGGSQSSSYGTTSQGSQYSQLSSTLTREQQLQLQQQEREEQQRQSGSYDVEGRTSGSQQFQHGRIGTNLLTSGARTSVIGGGGASPLESLSNAASLNVGSSSGSSSYGGNSEYSSSSGSENRQRGGGFYTAAVRSGGEESGSVGSYRSSNSEYGASSSQYGGEDSSYSNSGGYYGTHGGYQRNAGDNSYSSSAYNYNAERSGNLAAGGYNSNSEFQQQFGSYPTGGIASGNAITHRREMEMEEHYENGQLVHGREENKEWKNDELLKHDHRTYGQRGSSSNGPTSSVFRNSRTDDCADSPCTNGGTCITGQRGYVCICTFGFRGERCQDAYCPTRYCRHEGSCQVAGDGTHHCECPRQYTGPRCEHRVRNVGVH